MPAGSGWSNTAAATSVQQLPQTMITKRYIVIDTAHRDFVKQPNPYSNLIFSFGSQAPQYVNKSVTANNPTVPLYASNSLGQKNTVPGLPNKTGWVYNGVTYPGYDPNLTNVPNCNLPNDSYLIQPSGQGFGTVDQAVFVTSIRMVRAILPQKQFLLVPSIPGNADSAAITKQVVGKTYSAFSTYPYLLLNLDTYYGDYYGGNEPTRRTFSALTQRTRTQTDFTLDIGVQHYDYEPWGMEAHQLPAPIPSLQKLNITLTDPIGTPFFQEDKLAVSLIQADASSGLFLKCFAADYSYFSSNDLRIGDRVLFDTTTLCNMEVSPLTPTTKKKFIQNLVQTPMVVLALLDYVDIGNGVFGPRDVSKGYARTLPNVSSYNGFVIPNFFVSDAQGNASPEYPEAINGYGTTNTNSNVLEPQALVGSNLPFLNTSLQPTYTVELTCASPDTSQFGQNIV
jgi:hypothetical protein